MKDQMIVNVNALNEMLDFVSKHPFREVANLISNVHKSAIPLEIWYKSQKKNEQANQPELVAAKPVEEMKAPVELKPVAEEVAEK